MTNVAVIDQAAPRVNLTAGGKVAAIVPQSMDEAYRLAKAVCMAGMAPKGLDTPEKAMIAILHGMEIGLPPMTALQRIAVVNGRPTIWGDGAMSLVRGSGACEWIRETVEGEGDAAVAICRAKRRGEPEPIVGEFSVADAKKAGLWGKQGPWQQFPKRMLQMRARAFALRDGFADVLGGLHLKEEMDNGAADGEHTATRQLPPPPPPPPAPSAITNGAPEPAQPAKKAPPGPPPPAASAAPAGFDFEGLRKALRESPTEEDANDVYDRLVNQKSRQMSDTDLEECDNIMRDACKAFGPGEG